MVKQAGKTSKIDYTLLERRRARDFLEEINSAGDITIEEMEHKMEELMEMGEQVPDVLLNTIRNCDDDMSSVVAYALEYMDDPALIDPLMDIFIDPSVREDIKLRMLSIFEHYGIDTNTPEFSEIIVDAFDDIEDMMRKNTMKMLDSIQQDDEAIGFLLENCQECSPEERLAMVEQFGETKDERAVKILEIFAQVDDIAVAQEAIKYLGKIESPKAYVALERILANDNVQEIRQQAERSLRLLQLMRVTPDTHTEQRAQVPPDEIGINPAIPGSGVREAISAEPSREIASLRSQRQRIGGGEIYKAVISFIDGNSSRVLWVARWNDEKKDLETLNLMLNTHVGIKDCYGTTHVSRREFDGMVRTMREEIDSAVLDYDYALTLIKDAIYQNRESGNAIPIEFALWKRVLKQDDITPERYIPRFQNSVPNLLELQNDEDILEESYYLHDLDDFSSWFDQSPVTYNYWEQLEALIDKYRGKTLDRKIDALLKQYVAEVFEPQREVIKRNLEMSADILFRQNNRADEAQIALSAALNLTEESSLPLHEHPFIERMIEESLEMAEINLSYGFDVRTNSEIFD